MLCYRDRTFCIASVHCTKGMTCDRAITPQLWAKAYNWTREIYPDAKEPLLSLIVNCEEYNPLPENWLCQYYKHCAHGVQCSRSACPEHLSREHKKGCIVHYANWEPTCFKWVEAVRGHGVNVETHAMFNGRVSALSGKE